MRIEHRPLGPIDVLEISGRAASLEEASELRQAFDDLLDVAEPAVILDLTGLAWMDSGFMGQLMVCLDRTRKRHGRLLLVATGLPRDLLRMAGLESVFEIFRTRTEAVRSFDLQPS
jgi:anti-anti-sigma factor